MDFSELQQIWDQQQSRNMFGFDQNELHNQVNKQQRSALRMTNCMEWMYIGAMLGLTAMAIVDGALNAQWYQAGPAILFVALALYMLLDRRTRLALRNNYTTSIKDELELAIRTLEYQISRQKKAWIWFGLPFVSVAVWQFGFASTEKPWWVYAIAIAALLGLSWMISKEAEWKLTPQRDNLLALRKLLEDNS